jgi:hypothetical protein
MAAVRRVDRPKLPFDASDDEAGRTLMASASVDIDGVPGGAYGIDINFGPVLPGTLVACCLPSSAGGNQ